MSVEDRLRAAVHAVGDGLEPDEAGGLAAVRARGRAARRRRAVLAGSALALAAVGVAVVAAPRLDGGEGRMVVTGQPVAPDTSSVPTTLPPTPVTTAPTGPGRTTEVVPTGSPVPAVAAPTSTPPSPTVGAMPPPTTAAPAPAADRVLWPDPSTASFDEPLAAARSFVETFIGIADPPLGDVVAVGDHVAQVAVHGVNEDGTPRDRIVSTVTVERIGGHWYVTSAAADDVVLGSPVAGQEVARPVRIAGRGRGYEGTIVVEVRDAFQPAGQFVERDIAMAGCCEELLPFSAAIDAAPSGSAGAVVAHNDSGLVAVESFSAVPVRFAPSPPDDGARTSFDVHFSRLRPDGSPGELVTVARTVPHTVGVLRAALVAQLDGSTSDEQSEGLISWLPSASGGAVLGVDLDAGVATVDLAGSLAAAAPGPPGDAVLDQLGATVFQFANVDAVRFELDGSCEAFAAWLGRGCELTRP